MTQAVVALADTGHGEGAMSLLVGEGESGTEALATQGRSCLPTPRALVLPGMCRSSGDKRLGLWVGSLLRVRQANKQDRLGHRRESGWVAPNKPGESRENREKFAIMVESGRTSKRRPQHPEECP